MPFHVERNAVSAGVCAAMASVFSKLALENGTATLRRTMDYFLRDGDPGVALIALQVVCIAMMILSNVAMWIFYTRSLQSHSSTAKATVLNNACNFLFSSLFGWLIFDELLSLMWWAGFSLIIVGLALMSSENETGRKLDLKKSQ